MATTARILIGMLMVLSAEATTAADPPTWSSVTLPSLSVPACPIDTPHRVEIDTGTTTCTAVMCMGPLKCDTDRIPPRCWREAASNCNTCTPNTYVACLSDDDLRKAKK